jgi:hypothetical protein
MILDDEKEQEEFLRELEQELKAEGVLFDFSGHLVAVFAMKYFRTRELEKVIKIADRHKLSVYFITGPTRGKSAKGIGVYLYFEEKHEPT